MYELTPDQAAALERERLKRVFVQAAVAGITGDQTLLSSDAMPTNPVGGYQQIGPMGVTVDGQGQLPLGTVGSQGLSLTPPLLFGLAAIAAVAWFALRRG